MEKVAIVTGASRGIGREIAKELAKEGIKVVANYNKSYEKAKEKKEEVKKLVEYTLEKHKKIDILINNAGISEYKLFTDETDEDWQRVINTNLYSAFAMSQEVAKNMISNKSGCIINISSAWGMVGASLEVIYSVSKAGMDGLTKALSKELRSIKYKSKFNCSRNNRYKYE